MRYKTCVKCGSTMVNDNDRGWTCEPCLTEVINVKRKMIEDGLVNMYRGTIVNIERENDELGNIDNGEIRRA